MESITETNFDLVIAGTGVAQSLLALSLSRGDEKILHVDRNHYYGGGEAALNLQDAEAWASALNQRYSRFSSAEIVTAGKDEDVATSAKLGSSREYSLALAPQIVYSQSVLLPTLVASKVYRQLDFLAVGAWWIYEKGNAHGDSGSLKKIPGSREDVFADETVDLRAKRSLMKFLKFITDPESFTQAIEEHGETNFEECLTQQYGIPIPLQSTLHALTLSTLPASQTQTSFALPRILRHLSSIGVFGPGFGAVIPKWGGLAEIAQVGCRACAVGGGVYMLGQGVRESGEKNSDGFIPTTLENAERVKTLWQAGSEDDLRLTPKDSQDAPLLSRSISIVNSALSELFPPIADGAPPSACTVVVFPSGSFEKDGSSLTAPVYVMIHSSETGECPAGQSVLYASIQAPTGEGKRWLEMAIASLLAATTEKEKAKSLWTLSYSQKASGKQLSNLPEDSGPQISDHQIILSDVSTDLAFDDAVIREVRKAWQLVSGKETGFMDFEDREAGEYETDS